MRVRAGTLALLDSAVGRRRQVWRVAVWQLLSAACSRPPCAPAPMPYIPAARLPPVLFSTLVCLAPPLSLHPPTHIKHAPTRHLARPSRRCCTTRRSCRSRSCAGAPPASCGSSGGPARVAGIRGAARGVFTGGTTQLQLGVRGARPRCCLLASACRDWSPGRS